MHSLIDHIVAHVQAVLAHAEGGHDWWHVRRVWHTARYIAQQESMTFRRPINETVVDLGALLHDIADAKFYGGDEAIGPQRAQEFMQQLGLDHDTIEQVVQIVRHISFRGGHQPQTFRSPELDIVQDADRLDALGAIGIARAFNYGGFKNRPLYDPAVSPRLNMTKEAYKQSNAPTLNHFYEKLLLLKDRMNTATGQRLAEDRHQFMENFLDRFYREWEGPS